MYKKIIFFLLIILFSFGFNSCSVPNILKNEAGSLRFALKFPVSHSFSIKKIPENTDSFLIIIKDTTENAHPPILTKVDKSLAVTDAAGNLTARALIEEIPVGSKEVKVEALDSTNKIIATATKQVTVEAKVNKVVEMELELLFEKLKLDFTGFPAQGQTVLTEVKTEDGNYLFNDLQNGNFQIPDLPIGKGEVRLTVFSGNQIPLASGTGSYDINENKSMNVVLKAVEFPENVELGAIGADQTKLVPQSIIDLLNNTLIRDPRNSKPQFGNITLKVNGVLLNTDNASLKPGDLLEVEVSASDNEGDSLGFIWGLTSPDDGNYRMQILPGNTAKISLEIPSVSGEHFLGFIITDRKSFIGPITLPFSVI